MEGIWKGGITGVEERKNGSERQMDGDLKEYGREVEGKCVRRGRVVEGRWKRSEKKSKRSGK